MLETVLGWFTGHIGDALAYVGGAFAIGIAGYKMGNDGAVKAAQGAVIEKTQVSTTVAADVAALPEDELKKEAAKWTR